MRTTIKIFSFLFLILGLISCSVSGPSGYVAPANKSVDPIAEFDANTKTVLIDGKAVSVEITEELMGKIREAVDGGNFKMVQFSGSVILYSPIFILFSVYLN